MLTIWPPIGQNVNNLGLIFILLIDSAIKIWGYRRSCWVTFENFEILKF